MPKGFTLIEILLAIAILGMVTVIAMPNLSRFNRGQQLNFTTERIIQGLKQSQSSALSGIKCPNQPAKSWNFSLNVTGKYNLFAVCEDGTNSTRLTENLSPTITASVTDDSGISCDDLNVTFVKSQVNFSCGASNLNSALIKINLTDGTSQESVTVERGGRIY